MTLEQQIIDYLKKAPKELQEAVENDMIWVANMVNQLEFQLRDKSNGEGAAEEYKTMDILIQDRFPNHKFNDKHELSFKQFDYHDMLDFAESYHTSQMKKKVDEIEELYINSTAKSEALCKIMTQNEKSYFKDGMDLGVRWAINNLINPQRKQ